MSTQSDSVKIGVVGAGFVGQLAHMANYAQIKNCRIVALAAGRPELRRKVAQRYDIPRTYATHTELLEDKEVQAVVAVTARAGTGPVALDCLKAGKSLLTEKPMASSLEQAQKLVEAARSRGVIYSVGYMRRYDEGVQRAREILDELLKTRELGPVLYSRVHCFAGDAYCRCDGHIVTGEKRTETRETWPIAPDWVPDNQKQEYHQYLNTYCHSINLARYLFGKTPRVAGVHFDMPACKFAFLDFGGHAALLETGRFDYRGWDESVEIYFVKGKMKIVLPPPLLRNVPATVEIYKGGDVQQTYQPHSQWSWAFRRQAEAFVRDITEQREPLTGGADALEDMQIVETIWKMKLDRQDSAACV